MNTAGQRTGAATNSGGMAGTRRTEICKGFDMKGNGRALNSKAKES